MAAPAKTQNLSYEAFFNFAVTKHGKLGGKELTRILSFDFKAQRLNNIDKENINRTFAFADIKGGKAHEKLDFTIEMKKGGDYKCTGQSPQDVENIVGLLNKIANKQPLELERRDRRVLYAGHVLKYGHSFSGFDNRFLVLVPGKLFVFGGKVGSESYTAFPRNIVAVDNAGIALLGDGLSFNLKYGQNCEHVLPLYCPSKEARESWYAALKLSAQKCKNGIPLLPISNATLGAAPQEAPEPIPIELHAAPAEAAPEPAAEVSEPVNYDTDEEAPKEKIDHGDGEEGASAPTEEEIAVPAVEKAKPQKVRRGSLMEPPPALVHDDDHELAELEKQLAACQAKEATPAHAEHVEQKSKEMEKMSDGEKKNAFAFWKQLEAQAKVESL